MRDTRNGVPYEPFPTWMYCEDGRTCIVKTVDAQRALGPGWYTTPDQIPPKVPTPAALPADVVAAGPTISAMAAQADAILKRFFTVPVRVITDQILALQSVDEIKEVVDMEEQRPGGPRKGVLQAATARLEQLTPPDDQTS